MTYTEVEKILKRNGWKCIRIKGSHHQFQKDGSGPTITVPRHPGKDLFIEVLRNIEKGTGLSLKR